MFMPDKTAFGYKAIEKSGLGGRVAIFLFDGRILNGLLRQELALVGNLHRFSILSEVWLFTISTVEL